MPHIPLPPGASGIRALFAFRPEPAQAMADLANALLRAPGSLTSGEREIIAAHVSSLNDCGYCRDSHEAIATWLFGDDAALVRTAVETPEQAVISDKLKALLAIAGKVQESGRLVTGDDVARARQHGASDVEIHDTVLIAAAFCMFNRYVDGLAAGDGPATDASSRRERARLVATHGYSVALPPSTGPSRT